MKPDPRSLLATLILGLATSHSASAQVPKKPAEAAPTPPAPAPSTATPVALDKRIQRDPGSTVRGVGRDDASAVQKGEPTRNAGKWAPIGEKHRPGGSASADKGSPDKANIGGGAKAGSGKAGSDKADLGAKAGSGPDKANIGGGAKAGGVSDKASIGRDKLDSVAKAGRKAAPGGDKAASSNGPKLASQDEGASGKAGAGRKVDQTDDGERKTDKSGQQPKTALPHSDDTAPVRKTAPSAKKKE